MTKFLISALNWIIKNFYLFDLLLYYSFKSAISIGNWMSAIGIVQQVHRLFIPVLGNSLIWEKTVVPNIVWDLKQIPSPINAYEYTLFPQASAWWCGK